MPLPRALGRINVRVTNPFLGPAFQRLPGFGYMEHRGRRSGRTYRTPILGFRRGDRLTFAVTYGPATDWVRNILEAGEGAFVRPGQRWHLSKPRFYRDPRREAVPLVVRPVLKLLRSADFLEVVSKLEPAATE